MPTEVFNEAKWQAESDARTLADANEIKQDKVRLDKATNAADNLADKKQSELSSLRKVANAGNNVQKPATASKKYFSPGGGIKINKK